MTVKRGCDRGFEQVAIVSFGVAIDGERKCGEGYPGGFTEIQPFLDWIDSVIPEVDRDI